jgi:excisionase family DNA binding protein
MATKIDSAGEAAAPGGPGDAKAPLSSRPEYYVASEEAARFLGLHPRTLLQRARLGAIPAHPLGDGHRKRWRFLLSELDAYMRQRVHSSRGATRVIANERKVQ